MSSGARGASTAIAKNMSASTKASPRPTKRVVVARRTTPKAQLKPSERNVEVGALGTISTSGMMTSTGAGGFWNY